jgi:hypothetical protein
MNHAPAPRSPEPVRVVVEDVPELEEQVRRAARRAHESDRAVELVAPETTGNDPEAWARLCRRMDHALEVARRAAPGVAVRVDAPIHVPEPRRRT